MTENQETPGKSAADVLKEVNEVARNKSQEDVLKETNKSTPDADEEAEQLKGSDADKDHS